jgi:hypothetical protein
MALAKVGATTPQIAEKIGVGQRTVDRWIADKPGFRQALKAARSLADTEVESSLYARANGYSHPAVKHFFDARRGEVITVEYVQHYPPDTKACMFWLANRQPDKWKLMRKDEGDEAPVKEFKLNYARKEPKE